MTVSLVLGCLWVLAATGTALLPLRRQLAPGLGLLFAAPLVVGWLSLDHGAWTAGLALAAVASMFRRPLAALLLRRRAA